MKTKINGQYMERLYSFYSPFYDFVFGKMLEPGRREAFKYLSSRPHQKVLEIGIGTGASLTLYPPHTQVIGIDISEGMIKKAKKRLAALKNGHDVELKVMDACNLEFPNESFDAVIASYVITTVPDPHRLCKEILRVIRPGGQIIAVQHSRGENGHLLEKAKDALAPLFVRIGFTTDLDVVRVMRESGMSIEHICGCNIFKLHRLITGTKR
ncbi:class I SAM-dependent methyltransferase [Desulfobacca acetoxidans]|uniref:Methyltransferase type 11 n=1 Tax=Desulfobacca acetoxidans (strain ATCC 700848 / DSM 11109 / ASRB2) TaxID=880072 RepID=F2NEZ4_DESAR|nr:class I SAM-dependent methyltransferase [Desulfobacca acetoxidans]AEB08334.1 Methyltransferase type 11 [Desulfobacca acetoxidans DSM 11109]